MSNAINVINPYTNFGALVFDDENVGLVREPFVAGADDMLMALAVAQGLSPRNFLVYFSRKPFPDTHAQYRRVNRDMGGAWYEPVSRAGDAIGDERAWLCPALLKYFRWTPRTIHVKVAEAPSRVLAEDLPRPGWSRISATDWREVSSVNDVYDASGSVSYGRTRELDFDKLSELDFNTDHWRW